MEEHYKTLETIFNIIKDEPKPETYKCRPREIILRQYQSWTTIENHLRMLKDEGMVLILQEDTVVISITADGMEKIKAVLRHQSTL
jgi:predicted transcriptional regulator